MKVLNKARLDALERALKSKDGVLVVEQVEGGYELPSGEIVNDLAPLHKRYAVVIVDDVEYRLAHPEEWTDFERFCQEKNRRLNPQMYQKTKRHATALTGLARRVEIWYCKYAASAARRCTTRQAVGHTSREGVKPMRITIHVGIFTVTIIVKKRKNRHPAR